MQGFLGDRLVVYKGKTKDIYAMSENTLIINFKCKNSHLRNKISGVMFGYLNKIGIKNHFIQTLSVKEQLIHTVSAYPLFMKIHNIAHEEIENRLGIQLGSILNKPLIEWHLKSDHLNDPIVSQEHIACFNWITIQESQTMIELAKTINYVLKAMFVLTDLCVARVRLHFGNLKNELILISDISPENILFWGEFSCMDESIAYQKMYEMTMK